MDVQRTARATSNGGLEYGGGEVPRGSADHAEALTWRGRVDRSIAVTNPEELIAAAHAGCLSMT